MFFRPDCPYCQKSIPVLNKSLTEKERARQDIAIERDRAMNSLRNEVVSLSVAMAGKVVAKDMNSETNTKLIEDAIRQLDSKTIGL